MTDPTPAPGSFAAILQVRGTAQDDLDSALDLALHEVDHAVWHGDFADILVAVQAARALLDQGADPSAEPLAAVAAAALAADEDIRDAVGDLFESIAGRSR